MKTKLNRDQENNSVKQTQQSTKKKTKKKQWQKYSKNQTECKGLKHDIKNEMQK